MSRHKENGYTFTYCDNNLIPNNDYELDNKDKTMITETLISQMTMAIYLRMMESIILIKNYWESLMTQSNRLRTQRNRSIIMMIII